MSNDEKTMFDRLSCFQADIGDINRKSIHDVQRLTKTCSEINQEFLDDDVANPKFSRELAQAAMTLGAEISKRWKSPEFIAAQQFSGETSRALKESAAQILRLHNHPFSEALMPRLMALTREGAEIGRWSKEPGRTWDECQVALLRSRAAADELAMVLAQCLKVDVTTQLGA